MFGLDFITKLKPCKWRYTGDLDDGLEHFGFIAQEVDALASHEVYAFVEHGEDDVYRLRLGEFIGPLVKAVQELNEKVDRLIAEKGADERSNVGDNQAGDNDPLGHRHDLEEDLGDIRKFRVPRTQKQGPQIIFRNRKNTGQKA
jgi:hypothetical protein